MRTEKSELFWMLQAIGASVLVPVLLASPAAANPESARLRARAYEHMYNLDYDEATRDMEASVKADPGDIASERGLAVIPWIQISFQRGTLTVDEYLGHVTTSNVTMASAPSDLAARFHEHVARAATLAERAVAERPRDPDAHYQLGGTIGLEASYVATIEGSLLGAFRFARRAFDEHERVLSLDPSRHDAGLVVGTYRYLVSGLSLPMRMLAYAAGFGGGRARGIRMVESAAAFSGDGQPEAMVALVLVYNRELRFDDAMRVLGDLQKTYPRNRILWLEATATAFRAHRYQQAEQLATDALVRLKADARAPMLGEEAQLYLKRGMARAALQRHADAQADLRTALTLQSRSWVHEQADIELSKLAKTSGK